MAFCSGDKVIDIAPADKVLELRTEWVRMITQPPKGKSVQRSVRIGFLKAIPQAIGRLPLRTSAGLGSIDDTCNIVDRATSSRLVYDIPLRVRRMAVSPDGRLTKRHVYTVYSAEYTDLGEYLGRR